MKINSVTRCGCALYFSINCVVEKNFCTDEKIKLIEFLGIFLKVTDKMDKSKEKASILSQELKFARILASNDQKIRNGVLKNLKKWLNTRSQSSYRKYFTSHLLILQNSIMIKFKNEKKEIPSEI